MATIIPGLVVEFVYRQRAVRFFVKNVGDIVQSAHANGGFYEDDHLQVMEKHLRPGGVFLDVGANVGNHSIFVAKFCQPSQVIVVEPNPEAIVLLKLNLLLNALNLDTSFLGLGLSDREQAATPQTPANNLGGARMIVGDGGPLRLVTGDSLVGERRIDFIKIDVEGLEMAALSGLEKTIAANRPPMFVEVDEQNRDAFGAWLGAHEYEVAYAFPRYRNQNFVIRPKA